jgi:hypothetical protein
VLVFPNGFLGQRAAAGFSRETAQRTETQAEPESPFLCRARLLSVCFFPDLFGSRTTCVFPVFFPFSHAVLALENLGF